MAADKKACDALAPGLNHAKLEAALSPFGIDYQALLSEITAALVADGKKALQDVLGVIDSYLSGAPAKPCCRAGAPGTWLALLQQLAQALVAGAPTVLPALLQILAALLGKAPVTA